MPFLLAEILNFQGSTHRIGVGSFSIEYLQCFVCHTGRDGRTSWRKNQKMQERGWIRYAGIQTFYCLFL